MTFDWSEYLQLARELAGKTTTSSSQEAKLRSAISRAYYAAFVKARNFLLQDGLTIPRENAHQYVINQFRNSSEAVRRDLGEKLQILRNFRNKADYNDTYPKLTRTSQNALNLSRRIISGLDGL